MNPLSWFGGLVSRNKKQEQPKQQTPRINAAALQQALSNLSNTRLRGAEQLFGKDRVTIGGVAKATPVLGQAIRFGQNSAGKGIGDFTKGIASAGLEGAQYAAPQVKVFKGVGTGIKLANKFAGQALPSAGLSLASSAVNRTDPRTAVKQAAGVGLVSGAFNAAPTALGAAFRGVRGGLRGAMPYLRNEAGFINPSASVAQFKPPKTGNIEEAFTQVQDLKAAIAGKQQMYQTAKRSIELSKATPSQKLAQLRQIDDQASREVSALQKELGGWQEHAYALGQRVQGQPLTAPSMPTAPQKLSLRDRLLAPLRNERGSVPLDVKAAFTEPNKPKLPLKTRGLVESVRSSPEVSQAVQEAVSGKYRPKSNLKLINKGMKAVEDLPAGTKRVTASLDKKLGRLSDQEVTNAILVAKAHDQRGAVETAADIYDKLAEHLTEAGRTVQAASLLSRRTPDGLMYSMRKQLKKAGVDITPQVQQRLDEVIGVFKSAPDNMKGEATAEVIKAVQDLTPQNAISNLVGVWKAGLLSGSKTSSGNIISNATFGTLKKISDVPSTLADTALSLMTGKRAKTFTLKGIPSGAKQGAKTGIKTLKTGIDPRDMIDGGKWEVPAEINFKNRVVQKVLGNPANLVFRGMKAADQPFYYAALKNNLVDLAKVEAKNQGLKGAQAREFVNNAILNPDEAMLQVAKDAADKAVLGFDTFASKAIGGFKRGIDNSGFTDTGKAVARGAVEVIAPFTRVPSAFISRVIDYTPVGIIKTIGSQVAKKEFNQRQLAEAIGEATTGSALVWLGAQLAQGGKLSGDYPTDPKTQAIWRAEGITPNSIKIDGQWLNLNYLGPIGLLFGAGKNIVDAGATGDRNQAAAAIAGLGKGLLGQSFLQGFSGFSDAIKDPQRNLQSFINSQSGSIVPAAFNDLGNLTDDLQRQANSPIEAMKARLPFLRESLLPKIDAFGNDLKQASGSVDAALNPLKPSDTKTSALLTELDRLNADGEKVFPTIKKVIGQGSNATKLTPAQQRERQQYVGANLQPLWLDIINNPAYSGLPIDEQKKALSNALSDVNTAADRVMLAKYDPEKLTKPATAKVGLVLDGKVTGIDYLATPKKTSKKTPKKIRVGGSRSVRRPKLALSQKIKFGSIRTSKAPSTRPIKLTKAQRMRAPKFTRPNTTIKLKVEA